MALDGSDRPGIEADLAGNGRAACIDRHDAGAELDEFDFAGRGAVREASIAKIRTQGALQGLPAAARGARRDAQAPVVFDGRRESRGQRAHGQILGLNTACPVRRCPVRIEAHASGLPTHAKLVGVHVLRRCQECNGHIERKVQRFAALNVEGGDLSLPDVMGHAARGLQIHRKARRLGIEAQLVTCCCAVDGEVERIQVSAEARAAMSGSWCDFEGRGEIEIKGLRPLETWVLVPRSAAAGTVRNFVRG